MGTDLTKEKELLGGIQENLAVAKQAAEQLSSKYRDKLYAFIKNHLSQVDVEEIAQKTLIKIFNEIVSGQQLDDFFRRLQLIAEESARRKSKPRPMVLPPLDIRASGPATDIPDEELLREITQRIDQIHAGLNELFGIYRSDLLERVKPYVNYNVHDADDVVQHTYIRAYCKIYTLFYGKDGNPKVRVDHQFLDWLHKIAVLQHHGHPQAIRCIWTSYTQMV